MFKSRCSIIPASKPKQKAKTIPSPSDLKMNPENFVDDAVNFLSLEILKEELKMQAVNVIQMDAEDDALDRVVE